MDSGLGKPSSKSRPQAWERQWIVKTNLNHTHTILYAKGSLTFVSLLGTRKSFFSAESAYRAIVLFSLVLYSES